MSIKDTNVILDRMEKAILERYDWAGSYDDDVFNVHVYNNANSFIFRINTLGKLYNCVGGPSPGSIVYNEVVLDENDERRVSEIAYKCESLHDHCIYDADGKDVYVLDLYGKMFGMRDDLP